MAEARAVAIEAWTPRLLLLFAMAASLFWKLQALALPPHGEHAWRDADGLGVARAFLHESWNLLLPRSAARGRSKFQLSCRKARATPRPSASRQACSPWGGSASACSFQNKDAAMAKSNNRRGVHASIATARASAMAESYHAVGGRRASPGSRRRKHLRNRPRTAARQSGVRRRSDQHCRERSASRLALDLIASAAPSGLDGRLDPVRSRARRARGKSLRPRGGIRPFASITNPISACLLRTEYQVAARLRR